MTERLTIEKLGARGEGVAHHGGKTLFVPYALAGETVDATICGDHAVLDRIVTPSPDRIAPICKHYGGCGGCAVQALAGGAYADWKRGLVVSALRNAGLDLEVGPLIDAHGEGRRRVTFHARFVGGAAQVGFMQARSHDLVEIDACPLLTAALESALPAARAVAAALATRGKPLDIVVAASAQGLDIDLRGAGTLNETERLALLEAAENLGLARLSNHGRLVFSAGAVTIAIGARFVAMPPGVFLQATLAGEDALAARVLAAAKGAKKAADLFCGLGAFALRLAEKSSVAAFDSDAASVEALSEAVRAASSLKPVTAQARDLFRRPLTRAELGDYDLVVFDPPRAGAQAQAIEIAASSVPHVVAVSCNPQSFARDAATLLAGGYVAGPVAPIDQFRHSAHVELTATFERRQSGKAKRPLLR